ncbi:MAG: hypothetical protein P4M09_02715 [Devosia sp.]|nr:hypothetical protein [Devosia sp.]
MPCMIWGTPTIGTDVRAIDAATCNSPRAGGPYEIDDRAAALIDQVGCDPRWKARLTTWLVNQRRAGVTRPRITFDIVQAVQTWKPLGYADKIERFFLLLDRLSFNVGDSIELEAHLAPNHRLADDIRAWCELANEGEFVALQQLLLAERLIETSQIADYDLTPTGFERLEAVARRRPNTRTVFVAMWFDPSTEGAYEDGIKRALEDAGYEPVRVDRLHPEGKIDDEIIAQIRRARFIVADFTCGTVDTGAGQRQPIHRGGVYYEAGFAQGLDIPVIWSVRQDQIGAVHFDTRQFPHITWTDVADLRKALYNRVAARIGLALGAPDRPAYA